MNENLNYLSAFDTLLKAWNEDKISTETLLKAKTAINGRISSLPVNSPFSFGDTEHGSLSVNDLMDAIADNSGFTNYCDAIVQNDKGKLLIVQRSSSDDFQPGVWTFPGGKAEQGEFLRDSVKRELLEETGLYSKNCNYSTLYRNPDGSFSHYFWCYVEDCDSIILEAEEHQRYAWISLDELDNFDFMFDLKERIKAIFNVPFKGKYLTEQELSALAQVDIKKAHTETSIETSYSKGCLMLDTNWIDQAGNNRWDEILMMINPDDIYSEPGFGKEYDPHITVLYGFKLPEVTPEHIERLLPEGAVSFRIVDVSYFESDQYDVLKFGIDSPQLHELNALYRSLPHENKFIDYKPHLTIAYLKKGRTERYIPVLKKWVNYAFQSSKFDYSFNDENGSKTKKHWDVKGFESINDDKRDEILKSQQYQVGQISQKTGLKKVGPGKWIDPKTGKEVKTDENGHPQGGNAKPADISKHSDKDLAEYAKNSSEADLQAVVKESNNPRLREAAHQELDRREKEEAPQEDKKEKEKQEAKSKDEKKDAYDSLSSDELRDLWDKAHERKDSQQQKFLEKKIQAADKKESEQKRKEEDVAQGFNTPKKMAEYVSKNFDKILKEGQFSYYKDGKWTKMQFQTNGDNFMFTKTTNRKISKSDPYASKETMISTLSKELSTALKSDSSINVEEILK